MSKPRDPAREGKMISSNLRGTPALLRRRVLLKPSGERPTVLSSSTFIDLDSIDVMHAKVLTKIEPKETR